MHAAAAILAETTTVIAVSEDDLYKSEDNETVIDENQLSCVSNPI